MRKTITAALAATSLALAFVPAAEASIPPPPTDPVYVDGGGCTPPPDDPCDPRPYSIGVDKTYPSRLVAWALDLLP